MELIDTLHETVNKVLDDEDKASEVVRQITKDFGGEQLYIPQERTAYRIEIDREIYNAFNGCNVKELARKYKITTSAVYKIIKRQRAMRQKQVQEEEKRSQGYLF